MISPISFAALGRGLMSYVTAVHVKSLRSIMDKGSALPLNNDYFKMKDNIVNSTLIFQCKRYIAHGEADDERSVIG